jgi:hypothetical protein
MAPSWKHLLNNSWLMFISSCHILLILHDNPVRLCHTQFAKKTHSTKKLAGIQSLHTSQGPSVSRKRIRKEGVRLDSETLQGRQRVDRSCLPGGSFCREDPFLFAWQANSYLCSRSKAPPLKSLLLLVTPARCSDFIFSIALGAPEG